MLSGILNSDTAIQMNIAIMSVFVDIREMISLNQEIKISLKDIQDRILCHDIQLSQIYDAIENLMDEKMEQKKWADREQIGFITGRER